MKPWNVLSQIRRRVGEEAGVLFKTAPLRIALCNPSPYAAAMSSLGFQTIYRKIHLHPEAAAERAFLPDHPKDYRESHSPILTYESETPLSDFPIVAFSIAYELELTGIFEILDLSRIPILRQDRSEKHPIVIAGGPLTNSNPEILVPFVDLIVVGEGEEIVQAFLDAAPGMSRQALLSRFSTVPGCYVPGMSTAIPGAARVKDEVLPAFSQILTKNTVLASMFLIEAERGCSRSCSYCVMRRDTNGGMRPVSPEKAFSLVPENARRVGLVGAAVTDHPEIKKLVRTIVESGREIGISSLRADRLDREFVRILAQGGYRTLTTAVDGVSQRLRNFLNRSTTDQHLIRAAKLVREFKLQRLKLYAMIGVPGETANDIDELIRFLLELSRIAPISLSVSPFVPKKNTPLAEAPFEAISLQTAKLSRIRLGLKAAVDIKPSSPRWAWVEYMLSQGGETAGLAAMDAWQKGGSFSSWQRAFRRYEVRPHNKICN